jgi:hypothetical protein
MSSDPGKRSAADHHTPRSFATAVGSSHSIGNRTLIPDESSHPRLCASGISRLLAGSFFDGWAHRHVPALKSPGRGDAFLYAGYAPAAAALVAAADR